MSYPVTLQLGGRDCAVLGGGPLAVEKARGLIKAGARVTVITAEPSPTMTALQAEPGLEILGRDYTPGDLAGRFLAIDATGDEEVNRLSFAEAEEQGVLINVVDRPERCHFHAPALVRRGPLSVAISTGGESPFLAGALRARLERVVGEEWGPFTAMVGGVRRRLRACGVSPADQSRHYMLMLGGGIDERGARMAQAVMKIPARRVPIALDRLVSQYREERQAGEPFAAWVERSDREAVRARLDDLALSDVPRAEEIVDWDQDAAFTGETGEGECAV